MEPNNATKVHGVMIDLQVQAASLGYLHTRSEKACEHIAEAVDYIGRAMYSLEAAEYELMTEPKGE